jgi:hypothetical protein
VIAGHPRGRRRRRAALGLAALALAGTGLAGCGDGGGSEGNLSTTTAEATLSPAEQRTAQAAERTIASYCQKLGAAAAGQRAAPTAGERAEAFDRVDRLLELAASKPLAEIEAGVDMRLFISDLAENLEGSNCDTGLVEALDAGLAELP